MLSLLSGWPQHPYRLYPFPVYAPQTNTFDPKPIFASKSDIEILPVIFAEWVHPQHFDITCKKEWNLEVCFGGVNVSQKIVWVPKAFYLKSAFLFLV